MSCARKHPRLPSMKNIEIAVVPVAQRDKLPRLTFERVTAINLEVIEVDPARNLLMVKGSVPGMTNGLVLVKKSSRGRK